MKSQIGLQLWKIISIFTGTASNIFLLPIEGFITDKMKTRSYERATCLFATSSDDHTDNDNNIGNSFFVM
jgi:hypothetical protein